MAFYVEGAYECIVQGTSLTKSSVKGTPGFVLEIKPMKRNGQQLVESENPHTRRVNFWLTEKTADRHAEMLFGIGWTGGSWSTLDANGPQELRGANIALVCKHEYNNGETYERWDTPPKGGSSSPLESAPDVAKTLDAMFGAALKGKGPKCDPPKQESNPAAESAPPEQFDDDIPF